MLDYKNNIFPYQEGHQMEYLDEEDEWRCSECGRIIKFINGKKTVVVPGNEYAIHAGGRLGLTLIGIGIKP